MRDFTPEFIVLGFHKNQMDYHRYFDRNIRNHWMANIKTNHWILGCPIRQSNKYHGAENGDMTGVLMGM